MEHVEASSRADLIRRAGAAGLVVAGASPLLRAADAFGAGSVIRPAESRGSGYRVYRSRPSLRPPLLTVLSKTPHVADGYLFLAPNSGPGQRGVLIADDNGEPVWFAGRSRGRR